MCEFYETINDESNGNFIGEDSRSINLKAATYWATQNSWVFLGKIFDLTAGNVVFLYKSYT